MIVPLLLIVVGAAYFAQALGLLTISATTFNLLWPLVLVVVGLSMISHRKYGHLCTAKDCAWCQKVEFTETKKKRK